MDNFDLRKFLAESRLTNEGIFGTSYEKEQRKLEDALDRFVEYSMENGDSEDEILSTLKRKGRDAVHIYIGGKIDDDKLDKMYTDVMGEALKLKLTPEEKKTLIDILEMQLQYYRGVDWPAPGEEFFAKEIKIVTNILNKIDNLTLTSKEKSTLIYFLDMEIIKAVTDRSINTDLVKTILNKLK